MKLVSVFDNISHFTDKFYYGRYDIKTTSIEDLKKGKNFQILEFNGCGAEPNHIYDCNMSLRKAYGVILHHWKVLYKISRYNHRMEHLTGLLVKDGNISGTPKNISRCLRNLTEYLLSCFFRNFVPCDPY
jgi:hypothetical protein